MATITFLSGRVPFRKQFSPTASTSYPLIKKVSSQTFEYDGTSLAGLLIRTKLIKEAATAGACLLKGPLTKILVAESRAGFSDKNALAHELILDIDGIKLPGLSIGTHLDLAQLQNIAEKVVAELPIEFQNISYIAHASARMGMKRDQIRLHIDFSLRDPVPPAQLKIYLTHLNMNVPWLHRNTELSATSKALTFPLDRCLSENSRLIFIGHPTFTELDDPIPAKEDRIFFMEKTKMTMDLVPVIENLDAVKIDKQVKKRILELRAAAGLPEGREKVQRIKYKDDYVSLVTNPDPITMELFQDHGQYVTYNINGGDSHGYYVKKDNPNIVWNFKGEPPFLFSQAAPDAYHKHLEQYPVSKDVVQLEPIVFRDTDTNTYWNGFYNVGNQSIDYLKQSDRGALLSFMAENGGVMPDHPPQWQIVFDPNNPVELDRTKGLVNIWQEPTLLSELTETEIFEYGDASPVIEAHCPLINMTLLSATGDDRECYEHFINWLAFILQTRQKTETAWLFHGIEGTGKGVLATRIIKPMLENASKSRSYYHSMRVENIEEQFNGWLDISLIAFVDEFKAPHTAAGEKLFDKLKNYITESFSPIRRMRSNQELLRNRCNFIFTSNEYDPMEPSETDRRFNIAPRQEIPIVRRFPNYKQAVMTGQIERELPYFASALMHMKINHEKAMTALNNAAKDRLRDAAGDTTTKFLGALFTGDLHFFVEVFKVHTYGTTEDYRMAAMNYARRWIREALEGKPCIIFTRELKPAYNVLVGKQDNDSKFCKLLSHHGADADRHYRGSERARGFNILWTTPIEEIQKLAKEHIVDDIIK